VIATIPKKTRNAKKSPGFSRSRDREHNRKLLDKRRRRLLARIANRPGRERDEPMMTAANIRYELADRVQGLCAGGIGAIFLLARRTGFKTIHLLEEMVAEFDYRPDACKKTYRMMSSASGWVSTRGRCGCSRNTATSFTSPMIAR
jgi:hypothetical protein